MCCQIYCLSLAFLDPRKDHSSRVLCNDIAPTEHALVIPNNVETCQDGL
jgi:hypothetical protein